MYTSKAEDAIIVLSTITTSTTLTRTLTSMEPGESTTISSTTTVTVYAAVVTECPGCGPENLQYPWNGYQITSWNFFQSYGFLGQIVEDEECCQLFVDPFHA